LVGVLTAARSEQMRTNAELRNCVVQVFLHKNIIIIILRNWNRDSKRPPSGTFLVLLNPVSRSHFCENIRELLPTNSLHYCLSNIVTEWVNQLIS
jgi:hypothetical protein